MSQLLLITFLSAFTLATSLKCFQCGFGLRADIQKFGYLFGVQNVSPSLRIAANGEEEWCGSKDTVRHNESLVDCPAGCALFTVSDEMTYLAGCANPVGGEMTFIEAKVLERRRNEYTFIICTTNGCNASPEIAMASKKNPKYNALKYDGGFTETPYRKEKDQEQKTDNDSGNNTSAAFGDYVNLPLFSVLSYTVINNLL
ncbi:unnamed protein product [Bursaphelenchus xylophilus]|uniref:(pine wood nematode) hypothetical protein n=1 Tax=Bursaphelenchus xylophilus TaxID=6326 RepID=A0A1I7RWJ5_BURXY|nr:unnamed protein product [Bursaphelenchus xylophilus]CAG9128426.1 unnamed protein product [Bursaphelenchus xylophilus]